MTKSISSAPLLIASIASYAFTLVVLQPNGNPTTVQTETLVSFSNSFAKGT